uniref:Transferred entry: 7.1.1.9 n=1 Tax=Globodera pallida TaxID=36090 RepID=A0A183CI18_GLOPA
MKKVGINGHNFDDIERKLLTYAMATFLGHFVGSLFMIFIITNIDDPKTKALFVVYNPLIMDTGGRN